MIGIRDRARGDGGHGVCGAPDSGQPGYSGSFTLGQAASGTAGSYTVSVGSTPAAGTCTLTVTGGGNVTLNVTLTYTVSNVGVNGHERPRRR